MSSYFFAYISFHIMEENNMKKYLIAYYYNDINKMFNTIIEANSVDLAIYNFNKTIMHLIYDNWHGTGAIVNIIEITK